MSPKKLDGETVQKLNALDSIARRMDAEEWTGETLAAISVILTGAGYTVREPLLAFDFGELEPEPEERGEA